MRILITIILLWFYWNTYADEFLFDLFISDTINAEELIFLLEDEWEVEKEFDLYFKELLWKKY